MNQAEYSVIYRRWHPQPASVISRASTRDFDHATMLLFDLALHGQVWLVGAEHLLPAAFLEFTLPQMNSIFKRFNRAISP
jgi:hypothetical protein